MSASYVLLAKLSSLLTLAIPAIGDLVNLFKCSLSIRDLFLPKTIVSQVCLHTTTTTHISGTFTIDLFIDLLDQSLCYLLLLCNLVGSF